MSKWLVFGLVASAAWADIPPSDSGGCQGNKAAGAVCKRDDGTEASCVTSTCSRNDYSNGPPPTSVQYECLRCLGGPTGKKASCSTVPAQTLGLLALVLLRRRRVS